MKIHEYNEMMAHLTRRRSMSNGGSAGFRGIPADKTGMKGTTEAARKLLQLLSELKPGDSFNQSDLARKSGASRTLVRTYLKNFFPQLGLGTGRTEKDYSKLKAKAESEYKDLLDKGFLEDYKKRIQSPISAADPSLSNKALAKKYFPNLSETAAIGRLERAAARIRKDNPELIYKKGDPQAAYLKREERKKLFKSTEDEKRILRQQKSQKKIVNKYFQKNPEELLKKPKVKQMLDAKLVDGKLDFSPRYKTDKEYIDLAKSGKLFDEFDVTPIRTEKKNIQFPVNKNVGVGKFNQGFIKQVDSYFKKTKGSTEPDVLANKKAISDYLDSVGIRVEVEGERIGSKILPAIDRETGELPNIKNTLNKLEIGNLSVSSYIPPKTKNIERAVESINKSGTTLGSTMIQPELANLDTPAAKNLFSSAGKIALGELGFAGPSVVLDTYAGLTPSEMALNVATFGFGTPIKDSVQKRKYIANAGLGSDYSSALQKRKNLKTAPEDAVGQLTEKEKQAIFLANAFDASLDLQRAERAADYQQRQQSQLKRGELEIPDYTDVPEATTSIQPEFQEETTETKSLPFGLDRLLPFDDDEII